MWDLVGSTDQKILAVWAMDRVERAVPYFEGRYPHDQRPRHAIATLQTWIRTGEFKMAVIRKASLDALRAIHRAVSPADADAAVARERDWQYQHLIDLRDSESS